MSQQHLLPAPVILLSAELFLGHDEFAKALLVVFRHTGVIRKRTIAVWLLTVAILVLGTVLREEWRNPIAIGIAFVFVTAFAWLYEYRLATVTVNASLKAMKIERKCNVMRWLRKSSLIAIQLFENFSKYTTLSASTKSSVT